MAASASSYSRLTLCRAAPGEANAEFNQQQPIPCYLDCLRTRLGLIHLLSGVRIAPEHWLMPKQSLGIRTRPSHGLAALALRLPSAREESPPVRLSGMLILRSG